MLTKNEISTLNLSPTKKDFVQIWNELLEVAGKLSERWDPTSTNESDPGIVILKALTGIADKLNYNIDKNTLEAFMPTAAQEESMRKLCEMLGYNIKYYQSAKTSVTIKWYNSEPSKDEDDAMTTGLLIPKFTVLSNSDKDINYFTTNPIPVYISKTSPSQILDCMEGQIVKCESLNENSVITVSQITENNRFYLPETRIAENGIFVYNAIIDRIYAPGTLTDGEIWDRVDNLNTQARDSKVFKFGFDSYEGRPYIEFPEDYSELFGDGIFIYYTRTSGVNGNVSAHTLTQAEFPTTDQWGDWSKVSTESFSVDNAFAATSGANIETISQAYNNFKKTIGTFDTLVTCRDYMNKIYSIVDPEYNKPYVSNILVTDIRNDINRAAIICSCDDAGIFYKEVPKMTKTQSKALTPSGESVDIITNTPQIDHFDLVFYPYKTYSQIKNNIQYPSDIPPIYNASFEYSRDKFSTITDVLESDKLNTVAHNFISPRAGDVVSINNYLRLNVTIATNAKVSKAEGDNIIFNINKALANAFNMHELDFGEEIPFDSIIEVIEKADSRIRIAALNDPAVYTTFSVLGDGSLNPKIIEYAVSSDWLKPEDAAKMKKLKYIDDNGKEQTSFDTVTARQIYNKLTLRNVLAGRVSLFNYNTTFSTDFSEAAYQVTETETVLGTEQQPTTFTLPDNFKNMISSDSFNKEEPYVVYVAENVVTDAETGEKIKKAITYTARRVEPSEPDATPAVTYTKSYSPDALDENVIDNIDGQNITAISTSCELPADDGKIADVTLEPGEFIKFRAPNFKTVKTYPAYVNYHLKLNENKEETSGGSGTASATPAQATNLFSLLDYDRLSWHHTNSGEAVIRWQKVLDYFKEQDKNRPEGQKYVKTFTLSQTIAGFKQSNDKSDTKIELTINTEEGTAVDNLADFLKKSGCIRCTHEDLVDVFSKPGVKGPKANITYTDNEGSPSVKDKITVVLDSPYIASYEVITTLKTKIDNALAGLNDNDFPEESWKISFEFECVPFEAASLSAWSEFIKLQDSSKSSESNYSEVFLKYLSKEGSLIATAEDQGTSANLKSFKPIAETETDNYLWRLFGEGYEIGRYVLESGEKLLKFSRQYFSLLPEPYLSGIYLVSNFGQDAVPSAIKNDSEYALKDGEKLYIEYTPSSTTEDGSTQELPAVTEIYSKGTIIRPSGFDTGIINSDTYKLLGHTPHKTAMFDTENGTNQVELHSLGAKEQIEIRELAKVELSAETFTNDKGVFIYKNFNDCEALEKVGSSDPRKYVLKDNEYVYYTDRNKADLAYFTTGTEITLEGRAVIPQCDLIEDKTKINEFGIEAIPWRYVSLAGSADKITFQEFQYITLGAGDTLDSAELTKKDETTLSTLSADEGTTGAVSISSDKWAFCDLANYKLSDGTAAQLSTIAVEGRKGCGWEASSVLEFTSSPDTAQALRYVPGKINTSLKLTSVSDSGAGTTTKTVTVAPKQPNGTNARSFKSSPSESQNTTTDGEFPAEPIPGPDIALGSPDSVSSTNISLISQKVLVKTNVPCYAGSSPLKLEDVTSFYADSNKPESFKFKFFVKKDPVFVETKAGKPLPLGDLEDISTWTGEPLVAKSYNSLLNKVDLSDIRVGESFDKALRLSVSTIRRSYGIASFYVGYSDADAGYKTWIEVMPGITENDIFLINATPAENTSLWECGTKGSSEPNRLYLRPGINCIRFNKNCDFFIKASEKADGTLLFDDLKLVACELVNGNSNGVLTKGINLKQIKYLPMSDLNASGILGSTEEQNPLGGFVLGANSRFALINLENELLQRISEVDINREFFYTMSPENSLAIEFGNDPATGNLLNPSMNYDVNNVNNSFVISKLDTEYFDTGINIAKSSRYGW